MSLGTKRTFRLLVPLLAVALMAPAPAMGKMPKRRTKRAMLLTFLSRPRP